MLLVGRKVTSDVNIVTDNEVVGNHVAVLMVGQLNVNDCGIIKSE